MSQDLASGLGNGVCNLKRCVQIGTNGDEKSLLEPSIGLTIVGYMICLI